MFEVRNAVKRDSKDLANIIVESWKSAYKDIIPEEEIMKFLDKEKRQSQFERFIENKEIVLIGFYENIPCGLVFANKDNDEGLVNCGSIYSMYLLQEWWGKGLGTKLMETATNILKGHGCSQVSLWVYEENKRAINFYEKCKFKHDGNKKYSHFSNKPVEYRYIKKI